jgi:hypothetical protein
MSDQPAQDNLTDGIQPPIPICPPPPWLRGGSLDAFDIDAERVQALREIIAAYNLAWQSGAALSFEQYLNLETSAFLQAHPKAPAEEAGLESEALGPIGWLLWGWEVWMAGVDERSLSVLADQAVDIILDLYDNLHVDRPPTPPGYPNGGVVPPIDVPGSHFQDQGAGAAGDQTRAGEGEEGAGDRAEDREEEAHPACFVSGTLVSTPRGLLPIEQQQLADVLYAYDQTASALARQQVTNVLHAQREEILALDFGDETIRCTPPHRFYTGTWVPAKKLRVGDVVLSRDNAWKALKQIGHEVESQPVFNLTVAGLHTYLVGRAGLVVHNDKVMEDPDGPYPCEIPSGGASTSQ